MTEENAKLIFRFGQMRYDFSARTHIMGILNVTPDSFSDGGMYNDPAKAVERALGMVEEGADIIDVGGESSRPRGTAYGPGAGPISPEEELRRVLPVIQGIAAQSSVPVSIDTTKAVVAGAALEAGAVIVNDISAGAADPAMVNVTAAHGASLVLMHMKGTPQTMQENPDYDNLFGEIRAYLASAVKKAREAGIAQVLVDPGIGFGKTVDHNLRLLKGIHRFSNLGCPVVVGPSRKSFLGAILGLPVGERLEGTLAACVAAILGGAHVIRVHDIREAKRAALIADAIHQVRV
jgi:dihydropteroate synthase